MTPSVNQRLKLQVGAGRGDRQISTVVRAPEGHPGRDFVILCATWSGAGDRCRLRSASGSREDRKDPLDVVAKLLHEVGQERNRRLVGDLAVDGEQAGLEGDVASSAVI